MSRSASLLSVIFDDFTMYHVWTWWKCWDMDILNPVTSVWVFLDGVGGAGLKIKGTIIVY